MPYLPLRNVEASLRIINEFVGKPGVVGFLVTSQRHEPVNHNRYIPVYKALEEAGYPLGFHAAPTWNDEWMRGMNKWISMHSLSFVHCNLVHCTNWIMNGMPERFPSLNVIWIESGLAWIPFLMQRLDSEFLKRTSDAPLLTRLPSEYMQEMFYTSQPMEADHPALLEATFDAIHAETQLLYASDWPHWDFDVPASILEIPFLAEQAKRNILGENARKLLNL
jgi:predicted TIM-barrel fold metal-dependent hydrolase